jgi:hypothetical protein
VRWVAAIGLLAVAGGVAWRLFARPGNVVVTAAGAVTTEAETMHQFENVILFLVIGAAICVPWAFALGMARAEQGWRLVPVAMVLPLAAAAVARAVGLVLSPDRIAVPKHVKVGDTFPGLMTMDAWSALVAWAAFGLAGLLLATVLRANRQRARSH